MLLVVSGARTRQCADQRGLTTQRHFAKPDIRAP